MSLRPSALAAGAAAVVIVAVALSRRETPSEATPSPPGVAPGPLGVAGEAPERPPEFPPVADSGDRIANWMRILASGDDSDVEWAASRLRRVGDDGRRAVRSAGLAAVASNPALVGQALEFLLAAPSEDDAAFARAALSTPDGEAVRRAMRLVAAAPGADRASAARAVADAALASDRKSRLECAAALAKIGGDAAADEALRVVRAAPDDEKAPLCGTLAEFRHEKIHGFLVAAFAETTDTAFRLAVADALLASGDATPTSWLESIVAAPPRGPVDYADAALAALARARHPGALKRIGAVVADAMEDPKRRIAMLERLEPYALDSKVAFLEAAAADVEGAGDEIRIDAFEALVRAGAPGALRRMEDFVEKGDLRSANLAALVLGRLRLPEAAPSLVAAARRTDVDEDTRTMCLRALVLSGAPEHAEEAVRAMAQDHAAYGARKSSAQNIASRLGEATPEFRKAVGAALVRALTGAFGPLGGAGLVEIELATPACCAEEAASALAPYLAHADAPVRLAAAEALGYVASADTERDLRAAWWTSADAVFRAAIGTAIERAHFRLQPPRR